MRGRKCTWSWINQAGRRLHHDRNYAFMLAFTIKAGGGCLHRVTNITQFSCVCQIRTEVFCFHIYRVWTRVDCHSRISCCTLHSVWIVNQLVYLPTCLDRKGRVSLTLHQRRGWASLRRPEVAAGAACSPGGVTQNSAADEETPYCSLSVHLHKDIIL